MQTFVIDKSMDGKRIDRALQHAFPGAPVSAFFKAFRKRDIKVNGVRVKEDYIVAEGDSVDVYIVDNILNADSKDDYKLNKGFTVVYDDKNLIIVDKDQGIPVHPDRDQADNTLIDLVKKHLQEKGEFSGNNGSFEPSLCHRLDRNTGGLVIIAKNSSSLNSALELIKNKGIKKFYTCYVKGKMPQKTEELKAYLIKDEFKSRVFIDDRKTRDSQEIITRYRVLKYNPEKDISLLEVELVTGRTHQIRAHLAHVGHPIIGDGKYGTNAVNRPLGAKQQMLWAYKLVFDFKDGGNLSYLKGKTIEVEPRFQLNTETVI